MNYIKYVIYDMIYGIKYGIYKYIIYDVKYEIYKIYIL